MEQLKHCPFCNSSSVELHSGGTDMRWVNCGLCSARGPVAEGYDAAERAASMWNELLGEKHR